MASFCFFDPRAVAYDLQVVGHWALLGAMESSGHLSCMILSVIFRLSLLPIPLSISLGSEGHMYIHIRLTDIENPATYLNWSFK